MLKYAKLLYTTISAILITIIIIYLIDEKVELYTNNKYDLNSQQNLYPQSNLNTSKKLNNSSKFTIQNHQNNKKNIFNSINQLSRNTSNSFSIYRQNKRQNKYQNKYQNRNLKQNPDQLKYTNNGKSKNDISVEKIKEFIQKGNINKGKQAMKKCITCHNLTEKKHYIGPHLVNIIDRKQGDPKLKYNFSKALQRSTKTWSKNELFQFIHSPKSHIPNTKMLFYGIKKYQEIGDIIAYLKSLQTKTSKN